MIQKYNFHCPTCHHLLNGASSIDLKTVRDNGDLGLISLSTSVGNYSFTHKPDVAFDPGELVSFCCTSCDANLNSEEFENYAKLVMRVEENIEFDVLFSRKAGVLKTYLITEDGIETYSGT
jgi:hypothetical protein